MRAAKAVLGLFLFVIALIFVEIPLRLGFLLWWLFDFASRRAARIGCFGCLIVIPALIIYVALTVVSIPFVLIMLSIGWIDLRLGLSGDSRLDLAQSSIYWPHVLLFWLMPRFYRVEIVGPTPDLVYLLTDLETGDNAMAMPGPRKVQFRDSSD